MNINTEKLTALETAYYAALMNDPFEMEESTREMWKELSAIYESMKDSF